MCAGALGAAGCARLASKVSQRDPALPIPSGDIRPELRLLDRLTYGPRPGDSARVRGTGEEAFVASQLEADSPEDPGLLLMLARFDVLHLDSMELRDLPEESVQAQLQAISILRAVHGRNQLLERMVEFWSDHFNIYARKGLASFRIEQDESTVIRPHALGRFRDLLGASAHSPAMLAFLDNQQNRRGVPNENYAREIMELHTLGVHGGYTQKDVQEVARCLTGWTLENRFLRHKGAFRYVPELHDDGRKMVLGHVIERGGGESDGEAVLDILASHPSTAKHIARKLCSVFIGESDESAVHLAARAYADSGGDIRATLRPILEPRRLVKATPILKRPFDLMVSSLRALDCETDGGPALQAHLASMGQSLYQWPMPDGYPVKSSAWTGAMLARWNFAFALASNGIAGTNTKAVTKPFEAVFERHERSADQSILTALEGADPQERAALCLCSPTFQWR